MQAKTKLAGTRYVKVQALALVAIVIIEIVREAVYGMKLDPAFAKWAVALSVIAALLTAALKFVKEHRKQIADGEHQEDAAWLEGEIGILEAKISGYRDMLGKLIADEMKKKSEKLKVEVVEDKPKDGEKGSLGK